MSELDIYGLIMALRVHLHTLYSKECELNSLIAETNRQIEGLQQLLPPQEAECDPMYEFSCMGGGILPNGSKE